MSQELTAVIFGLACAVLWGAGDFSGGISTKRTPVLVVLIVSQIVGFLLMVVLVILNREAAPPTTSILWAAAAGISGGIGVGALYRALAIGQMGIAAPVAAVFTAFIPVLVGLFTEGLPHVVQLVGFGLALLGVWVLSQQEGTVKHADGSNNRAGIGLAVVAGVSFGMLLVGLAQAGNSGGVYWPLAAARVSSIGFMLIVAAVRRVSWKIERSILPIIVLAGLFDVLGNAAYVVATQMGRLDIAAVLSSLYPASTVMLAALILKERVSRTQMIAIGIVLIAIVLITLPKPTT